MSLETVKDKYALLGIWDDELYTVCMRTKKYCERSIELGNILLILVRSSCGEMKNINDKKTHSWQMIR
jgi:hypothetical protein